MPKTYSNLWESILDYDNLFRAFKRAADGRYNRSYVYRFNIERDFKIHMLESYLRKHKWTPGQWSEFPVFEPKKRIIHAPCFRDRVVHHALVGIIEPLFEKKMIDDSFACRENKGIHKASERLIVQLRDLQSTVGTNRYKHAYYLKADIASYFPSINHDILFSFITRTIRDKDVLWLLDKIINDPHLSPVGLPIGSLTSQLMANVYLNELDHYAKDKLQIKYYIRYMDDVIILDEHKNRVRDLKDHLSDWLKEKLALTLNKKTDIFKIQRGINFVGYRHWSTHKKPRKSNIRNAKERFRKLVTKVQKGQHKIEDLIPYIESFRGYMMHCSSRTSLKSAFDIFHKINYSIEV